MNYKVKPIGKFEAVDGSLRIRVYPEYRDTMTGLEDFSYVQVLWWFSQCDNKGSRSKQTEQKRLDHSRYVCNESTGKTNPDCSIDALCCIA